ncbi:MAG: adenylate kinase [Flavobacteriales bacterium]
MINIVIFGPPGAGKGTQAKILADKYHLVHLSTGDILRAEIAARTESGLRAKEIMDRGELVSDQIVIDMLASKLESDARGYIFDGFPRTIAQAEALDELMDTYNTSITLMLSLEVPEIELITRIFIRGKDSGRPDDRNEDVIRNRIVQYNRKTAPLIGYYSGQGKHYSITGTGGIEEINQRLCQAIESGIHA